MPFSEYPPAGPTPTPAAGPSGIAIPQYATYTEQPAGGVEALAHQLLLNSAQSRLGDLARQAADAVSLGTLSAETPRTPTNSQASGRRIPVWAKIPVRNFPRRMTVMQPTVPFMPHPTMFAQYLSRR